MSYTQANPDAHAQCLLWKLAKSGHGQLVTLHIGSQRVGRTDTRCVHVHTLLSVCLYQAWLFKTTPKRPERVNPISHPAVFWISDSLSARNQNNPYDWVSCLHEHWHTRAHTHSGCCSPVSQSFRHPVGHNGSIKCVLYAEDLQGTCVDWINRCPGTSLCQQLNN